MSLRVPIGISDFRKLREERATYVDKSHLIMEILDRAIEVYLFPRPRRFGKTLNLTMLRCFFEKQPEDLSHLFEGLAVWEAGEPYRKHFQRYPVLFITFRDVKAPTFEACWGQIRQKIVALFQEHAAALLDTDVLAPVEARNYRAVLDGTADPVLYGRALGDLSFYLRRATGERVLILIDEYDEPIHAGHVNGYSKEVRDFLWPFFTAGLKDNPHIERGVVTGLLRIPEEHTLSGLDNLAVFTLLDEAFSTCFGFTELEVASLLEAAGIGERSDLARVWYDGYLFGKTITYNPWSVLHFLAGDGQAEPYWPETSLDDLAKRLFEQRAGSFLDTFELLLWGGGIERLLDENVVLEALESSDDAFWNLLVFSGYLRAERQPVLDPGFRATHILTIPNREVRSLYADTLRACLEMR